MPFFLRLLTDIWVSGWTLLFIAILFMGGVQLLVLGVIGEYLGRLYMQQKSRPLYLVKEMRGFPDISHARLLARMARERAHEA